MINQRIDLYIVKHILGLRLLKFPLVPIHSCGIFSTNENPKYRKRNPNSDFYVERVFVYGKTIPFLTSGFGSLGPCDGNGGFFSKKRILEASLCTKSIYEGGDLLNKKDTS